MVTPDLVSGCALSFDLSIDSVRELNQIGRASCRERV